MKYISLIFVALILSSTNIYAEKGENTTANMPVSTKWILDAVGDTGRTAVNSVFMIVCPKTASKGTGFLLENGVIVTNEHVIHNSAATEVYAISSYGTQVLIKEMKFDSARDIAVLVPTTKLNGGLELGTTSKIKVGETVSTWGFPLGYNGPAPLLSVGYLAGFRSIKINSNDIKYLVVNGAFNPGNSGGPLFTSGDNKVIGIVVSKHAPISEFHLSAINALAKNSSGVVFTSTDQNGNTKSFVESQIVADLLEYFRSLTQVMIGEAISVEEVKEFLKANKIAF